MTEAEALQTVTELSRLHPDATFTPTRESDGFWVVIGQRGAQRVMIVQRLAVEDALAALKHDYQ